MNIFKKHQKSLVALMISLEIGLTVILCDQYLHAQSTMLFVELLMSLVIISMIILMFNENDELQTSIVNHKIILSTAPFASILVDMQANKVEISPAAQKLLNIHLEDSNISGLLARLPLNLFRILEEYINNPQNNKWHSKEGVVNFINQQLQMQYLKYKLSYTPLLTGAFYGIIIWLQDITDIKEAETGLIKYLHKYRTMSYELENLFSNLPFPIWKRQNNGEVIFYNSSLVSLMQDIGLLNENAKEEDIENAIANLLLNNNPSGDLLNCRRIFTVNNQPKHIDFHEMKNIEDGIIGYAEDNSEYLHLERECTKLNNTIKNVMQLSNQAILILNNQQKLIFFNDNFANFFSISPIFLARFPNFSQIFDKMREANYLPESKNFSKYKENCLNELRTLNQKVNYLYMPNGQMFSQIIFPGEGGNTIISYNNITAELNLERHYNELLSVYKTILNNHVDPICIYGQDGKLKMYNNKFASLTGEMKEYLNQQPHFSEVIKWHANYASNNNAQEIAELQHAIVASIQGGESAEVKMKKSNMAITIQPLPDNTVLVHYGT